MREQLEKWKRDKEDAKLKEKEDKKRKELHQQMMSKYKQEDEIRIKKEQIEEYKFRREIEKQREK